MHVCCVPTRTSDPSHHNAHEQTREWPTARLLMRKGPRHEPQRAERWRRAQAKGQQKRRRGIVRLARAGMCATLAGCLGGGGQGVGHLCLARSRAPRSVVFFSTKDRRREPGNVPKKIESYLVQIGRCCRRDGERLALGGRLFERGFTSCWRYKSKTHALKRARVSHAGS